MKGGLPSEFNRSGSDVERGDGPRFGVSLKGGLVVCQTDFILRFA